MTTQRWLFLVASLLALTALGLHLHSWLLEGEDPDWLDMLLPGFFAVFCLYSLFAKPGEKGNG